MTINYCECSRKHGQPKLWHGLYFHLLCLIANVQAYMRLARQGILEWIIL